jgi:raffinose/stachyose/melibiose transport system permease protein
MRTVGRRRSDASLGYLFFAPAIILVLVIKGYPLYQGLSLSFTRPAGVRRNEFAGLANYRHALEDDVFRAAIANALKSLLALPFFVVIPLLVAYPIFLRCKGWRFFRATYFFSYTLPPIMVGYMFSFVLGIDGPLNTFLRRVGLDRFAIQWFGSLNYALWAVFAVVLWSWFGLGAVVYLAGLATMDEDLLDAAKVDGAGVLQVLRHVIIPSIMPTIGYWSVVCTTGLLIWLFPYIFVLTEGGPGYASMMPEYYIYLVSTRYVDPGYASALGIILFGLVFLAAIGQVHIMYSQSRAAE